MRKETPAVCTTDEARAYFKEKGLTYGDITEGDILVLTMLLQKELKKSNKEEETSCDMSLSAKVKMPTISPGGRLFPSIKMDLLALLVGQISAIPILYFGLS